MTAYTDFHYSPTGSGVISGAQVLEQTEQGINGLGQYVQDNVSGAIDVANQALTTAQSADSNATTAINLANGLNAQIIAANQTAGNALTTAQSAQTTANAASSLATTANNNAATALNTANAASAGVTTLTGTVNSLGNRMTAAENAISANAGNITTLQNNLATTNANVTAAANAASAAQATATSAQSTATLARNQAYVLRYTGTTITGGGTIAYADIDNTDNIKAGDKIIDISGAIYAIASVDIANQTVTVGASPVINLFCDAENLIPAATDTYDLGSSSYQWNNLYAKNYYYNGTAWGLDKANVWTGNNQYNESIRINGQKGIIWARGGTTGTLPSSVLYYGFQNALDSNDNVFDRIRSYVGTAGTNLQEHVKYAWNDLTKYATINFWINADGSDSEYKLSVKRVIPGSSNTTDLGTSTNKWKTLNGVNPGALSLPNGFAQDSSWIGDLTIKDGSGFNLKTFTLNGWITINIPNTAGNLVFVNNGCGQVASNEAKGVAGGNCAVFIPVVANVQVSILLVLQTGESVFNAIFSPCLGNV